MSRAAGALLAGLTFLIVGATPSVAQLRVTSNVPNDFVDSDFALELSVSGVLGEGGRIAMLIDAVDVSALFDPTPGGYTYRAAALGLPTGTSELTVFQVDSVGEWTQIAAFELKVRSALGVEEVTWDPKLDLTFSAQPADGETPEPANPRDVPEVLDGKFNVGVDVKAARFSSRGQALLVGTSEESRRLRFRELADSAPLLDLSSYLLEHEQGPVSISLGHIRSGNQKHLISGLGSRGATLTVRPSDRVDANVGANAGRQGVGWSNLVGLGDGDHRVMSASMGVEAFSRPGALRLEVGWMDGSILPRSGFNQGAVTDAETSNGLSVRVQAQALNRRLRLDAGWAQSTFDNPVDPALNLGQSVVEVEETTKDARYLDATLDVIKGLSLGGTKNATLSVGFKHERIDPLYRTVATSVRADNLQNQVDVRASIAGISVTSAFSSAEDNLDEIASILKSNTDRRSVNVGLPFPRLVTGANWLPSLTYRNDRTHQFGEEIPTNGGFSDGHVPDQISVNQSVAADWRLGKVSFKYQLNHSDQDNRQEGREDADFKTFTNGFGLGVNPVRALQLSADFNVDRSDNLGADTRDNTRKYGFNASWKPFSRSTLSVRFSDTFKDDDAETKEQTGRSLDLKWASSLPGIDQISGTYFLRYNRRESVRIDRVRDVVNERDNWAFTVGANLSIKRGR